MSYLPDVKAMPEPGLKMIIYRQGKGPVSVAKKLVHYDAMIKASTASDKIGLAELKKKNQIVPIGEHTDILVIERHLKRGKVTHAVEARVLNGPYKDQVVWVPEAFTAKFE